MPGSDLDGQRALVTGGTRRLVAAIAAQLTAAGLGASYVTGARVAVDGGLLPTI